MASPENSQLTDAEYRSLAHFRAALRRFLAFSERTARQHGIAPSQHQLLLATRGLTVELDRPPSVGELADYLQLEPHSATELVNRAVANGLVERHDDEHDRRRTLVIATTHGRDVLDAITQPHRDELRQLRHEVEQHLSTLDHAE